jgi:hypothetical protein
VVSAILGSVWSAQGLEAYLRMPERDAQAPTRGSGGDKCVALRSAPYLRLRSFAASQLRSDHRYVLCKEEPLPLSEEVLPLPCGTPLYGGSVVLEEVLRSSWVSIHR